MRIEDLLDLVEDGVQLLSQLPVFAVVCLGGDVSAEVIPIIQGKLHGLVGRRIPNYLGVVVIQANEVVENELPLGGDQLQPNLGAGLDVFRGRYSVFPLNCPYFPDNGVSWQVPSMPRSPGSLRET